MTSTKVPVATGYFRFPTLHEQNLVFVCDEDLWAVSTLGGIARRLTSSIGEALRPSLSPDGTQIAFIGRVHGNSEIYLLSALGGEPRRLTYLGGQFATVGWMPEGKSLFFSTNAHQPFRHLFECYTLEIETGQTQKIEIGPAHRLAFGASPQKIVLGRNTSEPARWKRYRGGTAGTLWIDSKGDGTFKPLCSDIKGNLSCPLWIKQRIYFISDHEGIGNLYSCSIAGRDLKRHTHHEEFYVRNASTDGEKIVYHQGADIYLFDLSTEETTLIPIQVYSDRPQRQEKFVSVARYLEDVELHPKGHLLLLNSRGKLFSMGNWEGPICPWGKDSLGRYRLPRWNKDGKQIWAISDESGEERLVSFEESGKEDRDSFAQMDLGRPLEMKMCPQKNLLALSNHRHELFVIDLDKKKYTLVERSPTHRIYGFDWSPDGAWLAYSFAETIQTSIIKVYHLKTKKSHPLTHPVLRDEQPVFDPEGKYLYFLARRVFDPVYDNLQFDLNFPKGMRVYLISLQKETKNPFLPEAQAKEEEKKDKKDKKEEDKKDKKDKKR